MDDRSTLEKWIRKAIVAGVACAFFGCTFVIANTLKALIFGAPKAPPAHEIAYQEESDADLAARDPASLAHVGPKKTKSSDDAHSSADQGEREGGSATTVKHYSAGGETPGTVAEYLNEFFSSGSTAATEAAKKKASASNDDSGTGKNYGSYSGMGRSGGAASASSSGSGSFDFGSSTDTGNAGVVNAMTPYSFIGTGGGMNGVTAVGGYVVSVSASNLSAAYGSTPSGYQVWLSQGGQSVSP